jgi:hypothetical protein
VGSKTFDGVRFLAWSDDHDPIHVHGKYAGVEVVLDLYPQERRVVAARRRRRNPNPLNAKKSDVAHILRTAEQNFDAILQLAEETWKRRNL